MVSREASNESLVPTIETMKVDLFGQLPIHSTGIKTGPLPVKPPTAGRDQIQHYAPPPSCS
jgi:hypothetical protein